MSFYRRSASFLHVFFLCGMTAVPGAKHSITGATAIGSALWRLAGIPRHFSVLRAETKNEQAEIDRSVWVFLVVLPTAIDVSLITSGIGLLSGKAWAVPILAASCIGLLLAAARGAWDTLVTIAVVQSKNNESVQQTKNVP